VVTGGEAWGRGTVGNQEDHFKKGKFSSEASLREIRKSRKRKSSLEVFEKKEVL